MILIQLVFRLGLRNRVRALISVLGVSVTLLAFLVLRTLTATWYTVNEAIAKSDQLEVRNKISISFPVYRRMADKIRTIPGVEEASALIWFTGNYKDEKTRFAQLAVEGDRYFRVHPEYAAPPDQMQDFLADMSGAIAGVDLVQKYGWKLGDKVTLIGTIYPGTWDLTLRGIYSGDAAPDRARLFLHYKHLNPIFEHAHRLVVKADPAAAKEIDAMFANSGTPTKTESQLSVQRTWASWSGTVIRAVDLAAIIVLVVLALVLGNAMAMTTREAAREHAAMRAIGYKARHIMALVLGEGLLIVLFGSALGALVAPSALKAFSKVMEERLGGSWQLELNARVTLTAVLLALGAGMAAAALPAFRSSRLSIVGALRKTT